MNHVRAGAEEVGRDPGEIVIHCATATFISDDLELAREQCRWFPAVVGNHIADVLRHHDSTDMPEALWEYVRRRDHYDYREHAEQGTEHSNYVPDEIVDRFCVIGTVEQCREKLERLADLGVSEFDIYPHVEGIVDVIETYGSEIAPGFRASSATTK
jgi:alkanesulfonate monooxygenase SsuD/methylene tetrahydromethanopterin reductase-like flavin-dependent oxidoreductase (luciferase family)